MACPYGAPQYNADKGHMTKVRWLSRARRRGKKPICVESCPLRALNFGPIAELRAKYGQLAAVAPRAVGALLPGRVSLSNLTPMPGRGDTHRLPGEPEGGVRWETDGMNGR
ncbi:hypothetical protein LNP74_25655 [Klebsiella pneumoniae subsp. pneumoniae]|nr:hypothetical protein [Klebsiella pneumoniae subsp. pneumoniae]